MKEVEFLKNFLIFKNLSDSQIKEVLGIVKHVQYPKGEAIIQEGEAGDSLFIIVEGAVAISQTLTLKLSRDDYGEREKTLTTLKAEDYIFFGEMSLLEEDVRTATVTAATDCRLMVIKKEDFERLGDEDPDLGYKIVRSIARVISTRLRKANRDILKLTTALSVALSK